MSDSKEYLKPEILSRVVSIGLRASQPVEGNISGQHRSPLHGLSPEFADYRSYTPGDDLKHLDWRAFARSDRFYIKRFEEESNLRAFVLLDASASMNYGRGGISKYDCGATIAATLATLLLRQRDAVGLSIVGTDVMHELRPSSTSSQLVKLTDVLNQVVCTGETDIGAAVSKLSERMPRRGMVIVISDLLTPLDRFYESLGKLQYAGHELLLFHVLDRDEVELPFNESVIFRDIEGAEEIFAEPWAFRSAYQAAMEQFIDEVRQRCLYCGIEYLRVLTDDDLGVLLSHFLYNRQLRGPTKHRGRMASLKDDGSPAPDDNATGERQD